MPVLYRVLRRALRLGLELYYVDIRSMGAERVPKTGPVIFAANHPNSIMDTVVLGSQTDRTISYMARSGLFDNPAVALLFRNAGVIPIYRRKDGPADAGANDAAFAAAYDVLRAGGTIGIFPEGQNAPERHVRDIRTGTARIALGAEAANDWSLGVTIVPVGLNFEDRDRALTRVLVRFGEPIDVRGLRAAYEADEREAVRMLTATIQNGIRAEAVHIEDVRNTELVTDVAEIYGATLIEEVLGRTPDVRGIDEKLLARVKGGLSKKTDLDDWFTAKQRIAEAVAYYARERPEELERMRTLIRRHKQHLSQASLRRDFLDRPPKTLRARKEAVKMSLYAILLGPLALYGLVHNFVPARVTRRAVLGAPDEAMRAIRALVVGALAFGATYAGFGASAYHATGSPWATALYLATLPFAGMWWVRYRRQLARYGSRLVVRALFRRKSRLLRSLALEREQIFMQLDVLRREIQEVRRKAAATTLSEGGG
jgi:1-acyl-sn-glycerol-3-phosphate acyltransferase